MCISTGVNHPIKSLSNDGQVSLVNQVGFKDVDGGHLIFGRAILGVKKFFFGIVGGSKMSQKITKLGVEKMFC